MMMLASRILSVSAAVFERYCGVKRRLEAARALQATTNLKRTKMDRKNGPANFRSADDEMFAFLSSLGDRWRVSEGGARFIEENFTFVGSKPVLWGLKDYATADCLSFAGARSFIDANPAVKTQILNGEICYLGDSLTSAEVKFAPEYFYDFLKFIMEQVPEHHYFFSPTARWLLLVAMEKYVEFAALD